MNEERGQTFHCPLCGHHFHQEEGVCSGSCPLGKYCGLICCPRCRYRFVEESGTVNFLKRFLGKKKDEKEVGR
ncbi:MAG: hypothetical protein FJ117_13170 [Deltaproteobacteria bacterium]|nr:hypothetical protein [Deltaproteobacteria bacterium]